MTEPATVLAFLAVVVGTSLVAVTARWFRPVDELPTLEGWALAGRQFGGPTTWFLLGGTIYTAYTFAAVPGLVYGAGALGFFALPYTVIVYPLAFVLLPRLWTQAREHGYITVADFMKGRHGSAPLALAVALTGILATMPYIALQLLGIRAVLTAGGLYPQGSAGDLALIAVFAVLAAATYRHGLRSRWSRAPRSSARSPPSWPSCSTTSAGRAGSSRPPRSPTPRSTRGSTPRSRPSRWARRWRC